MVGLGLGLDPKSLGLSRHIVSTKRLLSELALAP
jgi:heterodisulfide reductase subunit B